MPNSEAKLSRNDLHDFIRAMTVEMGTDDFLEKLRVALSKEKNLPTTEDEYFAFFEKVQEEFLTRYAKKRQEENASEREGNSAEAPLDGAAILRELKEAVVHYPDSETERLIMQMCMLHKALMESLCATTPALATSLQQNHQHQHSHGQSHGHSHDHGHGHSHGQSHGHSHSHGHGQQECHGHGAFDPQQMREMQMAVESLPPNLREDMTRIQQKMFTGQPPTQDDINKMQTIQNHILAFVSTMRQFESNNSSSSSSAKKET